MQIYSQDIGTEFAIEKCVILIMKRQTQNALKMENPKYLEILETDSIKHAEMKEKKRIPLENEKTTRN